tara:strand:+ start:86 stop:208 length:123 start_codon:yes stop_codon:yes gene_type:complete
MLVVKDIYKDTFQCSINELPDEAIDAIKENYPEFIEKFFV